MSVSWQFQVRDTNWESRCRTRHIQIRTMYRRTVNKTTWSNPRYSTKFEFTFRSEFSRHPTGVWVFIMNERVNESISRSFFNVQRELAMDLIKLDALLRVPRQSLYWEALAILQLSLNVLHLKSCEIQSNRCAWAILPSIAFLGID